MASNRNDRNPAAKRPWGDAFAVIGEGDEARWIDLGPVWDTKGDGFSFVLESEPLAWRNLNTQRRIVMRPRKGSQS